MNTVSLFFTNKYNQIKNFFVGISPEKSKILDFTLTQIEPYSYVDFSLTIDQKIELEKRRRYQAYMMLDYFLSVLTYFDFFSVDSFQIAKKAKDFAQLFERKIVTSDFLLLPFFQSTSEIPSILEKYGITEKEVGEILYTKNKISDQKMTSKIKKSIKNFLLRIDIPLLSEALVISKRTKYSFEVDRIFKKAAENALTRFKTPVISSEILLITILESKKTNAGKLLKQLLKNDTNWYMLRYSLMKRLHTQELAIRKDVPKNQQYFAYLLKTQLPEFQFDTLIEKDCLLPGVLLFRNNMIADIMKLDLYKALKEDILASIKANRTRKYLT